MNKKSRKSIVMVAAFVFAITSYLVNLETASAQETRIIRLSGVAYPTTTINIEPKVTFIAKGSVVVWVNLVRAEQVKVNFREGKKCLDVTKAPTGFKLDAQQCYVTDFIRLGGTSSLKFVDRGTYKYEVTTEGGAKESGEIIVR